MPDGGINGHQCRCPRCKSGEDHPARELHRQICLVAEQLNEQHRRWYVAILSKVIGYGGDRLMSLVTGMNVQTIRRGRRELDESLRGRPAGRIRLPGAGRKPHKKMCAVTSETDNTQ